MQNPSPAYKLSFVENTRKNSMFAIHSQGCDCQTFTGGVRLSHLYSSEVMKRAKVTLSQMIINVCTAIAKTHDLKHSKLRKILTLEIVHNSWGSIIISVDNIKEKEKFSIYCGCVEEIDTGIVIAKFEIKLG